MRIGPIVLALRMAATSFGNNIAGAAELGLIMDGGTLPGDTAFVVPVSEDAVDNKQDTGIAQVVTERFAILVALTANADKKDKLQLVVYDRLHDIRAELLHAVLGLQLSGQESVISYAGGKIVDLNRAYMWYQYEFVVKFRLDDDDGVDVGEDALPDLEKIYAQYLLAPNSALPLPDGTTLPQTLFETNLEELITWPREFGPGFGAGFDVLEDHNE